MPERDAQLNHSLSSINQGENGYVENFSEELSGWTSVKGAFILSGQNHFLRAG